MTLSQFDNGYWYVDEIKNFAKEIGIRSSKLRKDELELLIRHFLKTGKLKNEAAKKKPKSGLKDYEKGLTLKLSVINYTNDKETKDFILRESLKINPDLKIKSGVRYRLNRWREEQINNGIELNYEDIVRQFIKLNQVEGSFPKVPHGRYINFVSDYLTEEKGATRKQAIKSWKELKKWDIPKNYASWKKHRRQMNNQ